MRASSHILILLLTLRASTTFAATLPDAGRLLKENSNSPSLVAPRIPPYVQHDTKNRTQVTDTHRIAVTGFTFTGNTLFSDSELAALMANSIGKKLTLSELNSAATIITAAYRKKGYFLASVFFPPQTLAPGKPVVIEVIEGLLEKISVETTPAITRTQKSLLEYYANQVSTDKPLENGALTSMVMRTNELPNISSRILLEPGSRPGTTQATLKVIEGKPYSYFLSLDNYGNEATGENHFSVSMELYSPLHLGDQFNVRVQTSTTGDLKNIQSSYTLPVTPYGTKIGLNYNYVTYQMGGAFTSLHAHGSAHNISFSLTHPIIRSRNTILNATFAGEGRVLNDRIETMGSSTQRFTASCQTGLSGIQMDNLLGGGSTSMSLGLIGGETGSNDILTFFTDQSTTGLHTTGYYSKINMSLARTQTIRHGLSIYTGAYGQLSSKNLNSSEQLSLGGPSAVRAWQTNESSADKGIIATAELRYHFEELGELPGKLELSVFIDHCYATLHNHPLPDAGSNIRTLTGAGVGIKWFDSKNYSLQSTAAWKITKENSSLARPVLYAQAIKIF